MERKKFRDSKIYQLFVKLNSKDFGNLLDQVKIQSYEQEELRKKDGLRFHFEKEYINSFNGMRERHKRD
ncbi:hypothetical protein [Ligilactobacillus agilis]|uniref:hypothetical protein n=1 Tax=Ligilactobacillus agilis TaxID=1601 RepID=UPI00143771D8|nr:hypothetical protein [Ligilactobacillus agilis]GET11446.1 hypothetical protein SN10121_19360 [Ligilactobacillus agilis]